MVGFGDVRIAERNIGKREITYNIDATLQAVTASLSPQQFGSGLCATSVRIGLQASGLGLVTWPRYAKDWGGALLALGFTPVTEISASPENSAFQRGDVVVIQAYTGQEPQAGHIQIFDGTNWVSDFVQTNGFWPGKAYRDNKPPFVVYRYSNTATVNRGLDQVSI